MTPEVKQEFDRLNKRIDALIKVNSELLRNYRGLMENIKARSGYAQNP